MRLDKKPSAEQISDMEETPIGKKPSTAEVVKKKEQSKEKEDKKKEKKEEKIEEKKEEDEHLDELGSDRKDEDVCFCELSIKNISTFRRKNVRLVKI